jgi:hypothetical protein
VSILTRFAFRVAGESRPPPLALWRASIVNVDESLESRDNGAYLEGGRTDVALKTKIDRPLSFTIALDWPQKQVEPHYRSTFPFHHKSESRADFLLVERDL